MAGLIHNLTTWVIQNSITVLIASMIIFGITSLIYLIFIARMRGMVVRYHQLLATIGERDVEQMLLNQAETVRSTKETVDRFQERLCTLEQNQESHLQRIGVVRFNAFAETGSDLSFAVAIMDYHNNGVVISCIHGRDEARTYAKPLVHGRSSYPLSREELLAIEKASQAPSPGANEGKHFTKSE